MSFEPPSPFFFPSVLVQNPNLNQTLIKLKNQITQSYQPLSEGSGDEVVGELLIPVSRLPQNEPVEQWYGLEPPQGSGKTFTKAALLLRFLFTTTASPSGGATAVYTGGVGSGGAGVPMLGMPKERGTQGTRGRDAAGSGGVDGRIDGGQRGRIPGVRVEGSRGQGSVDGGTHRRGSGERGGRRRGELEADPSIDPFDSASDDDIDDEDVGLGALGEGGMRRGELTLPGVQQLQLGNLGGTLAGTVHAVGVMCSAMCYLILSYLVLSCNGHAVREMGSAMWCLVLSCLVMEVGRAWDRGMSCALMRWYGLVWPN